jgi:ribonuclease HII
MLSSRYADDDLLEAGIDEAGRGCFWGPMIAAAVIWPTPEAEWSAELRAVAATIKDSKKLTPKRRAVAEAAIKTHAVAWAIGRVEAEEIDALGMTAANQLAFTRAVQGLSVQPQRLLVDGFLQVPGIGGMEQIIEPKADGTYLAVAAASILAKEEHDRIIVDAVAADPVLQERYCILKGKGYGTAPHCSGLLTHGVYAGHRRLFLRNLLGASVYTKPVECLISEET